jgi:hypothetical protein
VFLAAGISAPKQAPAACAAALQVIWSMLCGHSVFKSMDLLLFLPKHDTTHTLVQVQPAISFTVPIDSNLLWLLLIRAPFTSGESQINSHGKWGCRRMWVLLNVLRSKDKITQPAQYSMSLPSLSWLSFYCKCSISSPDLSGHVEFHINSQLRCRRNVYHVIYFHGCLISELG